MSEKSILCRCEDITEEEVIKAIDEGFTDIEELRKKLRIGMGACQGRVCTRLVMIVLAKKTGIKPSEIKPPTSRPPTIPVTLGTLASEESVNEK